MTLEALQRIVSGETPAPPVAVLLGMRMVAAELGRVTFELDAGHEHSSPPGIKAGRTLSVLDCRITDDSGSLVAYATSTCMTVRRGED